MLDIPLTQSPAHVRHGSNMGQPLTGVRASSRLPALPATLPTIIRPECFMP
jgi:hypothetical protein